jgi:hypothetical protein
MDEPSVGDANFLIVVLGCGDFVDLAAEDGGDGGSSGKGASESEMNTRGKEGIDEGYEIVSC